MQSEVIGGGGVAIQTTKDEEGKVRLGFSLSADAQRMLQELKKKTGLNQTGIVELAIRDMASKHNVK
jgi:ribosomal protein L20A (L18A)